MFKFNVGDKEYTVAFSYRELAKTDVMSRAQDIGNVDNFGALVESLGEFLLVGLQKYHSKEFGFSTDEEKEKALDKVYDLLDEMDEEELSVLDLFNDVSGELMKNRFLSELLQDHEPKKAKKK